VTRAALDAEDDTLPDFWGELGALGALGIHIPEEFGGQGAGMLELAVVAEELGRAAAPGPWSSTAVVAAVVAGCGGPVMAKEVLPGLVDGTVAASLVVPTGAPDGSAVARSGLTSRPGRQGALLVSGTLRPIPNGATVTVVLAPVECEGATVWALLERSDAVVVEPLASFDPTRRSAGWSLHDHPVAATRVLPDADTTNRIRDLALVVASAEAVGGARWCLDTAAEHARTRHQFGRPIGQFQGVKHRLADMLVTVEQAAASTWDAAMLAGSDRPAFDGAHASEGAGTQSRLATQLAATLALDGYVEAAKGAIQVLGGMGFTWEHDVHVHLRRATTLRQLLRCV